MNKKKTIIICLLGLVVCLGIGFAAFSTTLKINGKAKVSPNEDNFKVFFVSSVNSVSEYSTEDFYGIASSGIVEPGEGHFEDDTTFINTGLTFTEDGQSVDYKFYILNAGKYDAHITNLDIGNKTCTPGEDADPALAEAACDSINLSVILGDEGNQTTYTSSQAIENHVLAKETWEQIIVRITYPEGSPLSDGELQVVWNDLYLLISSSNIFEPVVNKNYLMEQSFVSSDKVYKPFRFDSAMSDEFESVKFLNVSNVPQGVIEKCDVSLDEDGSVIAWYVDEDKDGLYELYIGSDGKTFLTSGKGLFSNFKNVTSIVLDSLDTSETTTFYQMFYQCSSLQNLDLSNFDTSKVEDMGMMFDNCSNLLSVNLSSFVTTNLLSTEAMFVGCKNLLNLDLSNFYTPNLTNMENMFVSCEQLKNLDISHFDTSNVESMSALFAFCYQLRNIDLSNFNTSKVTNMQDMFIGCRNLETLNIQSFDTRKVTNMQRMFYSCDKLMELDLSSFVTSELTSIDSIFAWCVSLQVLKLNSFIFDNVIVYANAFFDFPSNAKIYIKDTQNNRSFISTKFNSLSNIEWV